MQSLQVIFCLNSPGVVEAIIFFQTFDIFYFHNSFIFIMDNGYTDLIPATLFYTLLALLSYDFPSAVYGIALEVVNPNPCLLVITVYEQRHLCFSISVETKAKCTYLPSSTQAR